MAYLNKVFLIGNLTKDVELRYTTSGVAIAQFGLAINRKYQGKDGEAQEEVCFVDVVAWDKLAERCAEYLSKGRLVLIEGRLQYQTWEQEAKKRSKIEVVATNIQFLSRPKDAALSSASSDSSEPGEEEIPF